MVFNYNLLIVAYTSCFQNLIFENLQPIERELSFVLHSLLHVSMNFCGS